MAGTNVAYGRKAARCHGELLNTFDQLLAHLQVVLVFGGLVQKVGALDELRPDEELRPVRLKIVDIERFRQQVVVHFGDLV